MDVFLGNVAGLWTQWLWPVLQLLIGLGLLIFVHELGHFLAARWVGIKVERLALGMGPRLFGIRRGETDYCVNALPLGGYVRMLGQEDFKPLEENQKPDPRSFMAKSVGARLFVLSAGVVMNVIFAAILFIVVCLVGIKFRAPVVGNTVETLPAARAKIVWDDPPEGWPPAGKGLEPGDRILSIDGKYAESFEIVQVSAVLAHEDETFEMRIERTRNGKKVTGTAQVGVEYRPSDFGRQLMFGIAPAADIVFFDEPEDAKLASPFRKGDKVVKINGRQVRHNWDIAKIEKDLDGRPATVTVLRDDKEMDFIIQPDISGGKRGDMLWSEDKRYYGKEIGRDKKEVTFHLEDGTEKKFPTREVIVGSDELLDVLGMIPRLKVTGVIDGSPAGKSGLEPGDIIADYGERGPPTFRNILDINEEFADKEVRMVVLRNGESIRKWLKPKSRKNSVQIGIMQMSDLDHAVVAGVRAGSPADKAGIRSGDVIEAIVPEGEQPVKVENWVDVLIALKKADGKKIGIICRGDEKPRSIGLLDKKLFDPADYKVSVFESTAGFNPLTVTIQKPNPLAAIAWGARKTCDQLVMTYGTLRSMITGRLSTKALSGPVGIGGIAIKAGRHSVIRLVYFMAFLSVTLAVINFLPIPVLDGGHAVFLLIEKIRGKPVPVKIMNIVQITGLALLLGVIVAVTWQDIARILGDRW